MFSERGWLLLCCLFLCVRVCGRLYYRAGFGFNELISGLTLGFQCYDCGSFLMCIKAPPTDQPILLENVISVNLVELGVCGSLEGLFGGQECSETFSIFSLLAVMSKPFHCAFMCRYHPTHRRLIKAHTYHFEFCFSTYFFLFAPKSVCHCRGCN